MEGAQEVVLQSPLSFLIPIPLEEGPSRYSPGAKRISFSTSTHLLWETQHSPAPQNGLRPRTVFTRDIWGGGRYSHSDQI